MSSMKTGVARESPYTARAAGEVCITALLLLVPLAIQPAAAYPFESVKVSLLRVLSLTGAFCLLVHVLRGRNWCHVTDMAAHRRSYSFAMPILFAVLALALSTLLAKDRGLSTFGRCGSMAGTYTLLCYPAVWLVTAWVVHKPTHGWHLLQAAAVAGGLSAVYAVVQALGLDPIDWYGELGGRSFSTLGHPNSLGAYLAMTLPLTVALALRRGQRAETRLTWASIVLLQVAGSVASGSRGGMTAALIALGTYPVVAILRSAHWRRWCIGSLLLFGCLVLLCLWRTPRVLWSVVTSRPQTVVSRLVIWQVSLELAAQEPVTGFGPDAFGLAFQAAYPPELAHFEGYGNIPDHAHNLILDTLVTLGAVGLAALFGLGCAFAVAVVAYVRRARSFPWMMTAILAAAMAYAVHGLFGYDVVSLGSLLAVLAGVASSLLAEKGQNRERAAAAALPAICSRMMLAFLAVLLLLVWTGECCVQVANACRGMGQKAALEGDASNAAVWHERAASLYPACEDALILLARARLSEYRETGDAAQIESAEQVLQIAQQRHPLDATNYANLGHLYLEWSCRDPARISAAVEEYGRALALRPSYPPYWDLLGVAQRLEGNDAAAMDAFGQALALDPIHVPSWVQLGELYLAQGNDRGARIAFASALEAARQWATVDPGILESQVFGDELYVARAALDRLESGKSDE